MGRIPGYGKIRNLGSLYTENAFLLIIASAALYIMEWLFEN
jgi:hypothetical protein